MPLLEVFTQFRHPVPGCFDLKLPLLLVLDASLPPEEAADGHDLYARTEPGVDDTAGQFSRGVFGICGGDNLHVFGHVVRLATALPK